MAKKSKVAHGSKAGFVRANPTVSAADLVALAKKQGISLTVGHVYNIRANDKKQKRMQTSSPPAQADIGSPRSASSSTLEPLPTDTQLRTLILRMGLDRAEQIFSELKRSVA